MVRHLLLQFSSVLLFWMVFVAPCLAAWDVTPLGEGFASDIEVDSMGLPHLGVTSNGNLDYRTLVNGVFVTQETISFSSSFALDQNDKPFFVAETGPGFWPELLFRDDQGTQQAIPIANHRVGTLELIGFDSQNRPHVAYNHPDEQELIHSSWDGASWTPRVVASGPTFRFANSRFTAALDGDDQAHFVWDDELKSLQYSKPNESGWTSEPLVTEPDVLPYNVEIDNNGNIHYAYIDLAKGLSYGTNQGGGDPQNELVPVAKKFGGPRASLVLDNDQRPSIFSYDAAFFGPVDLVHYELSTDEWESTIVDTHPDPEFSGPDEIQAAFGGGRHHVLFSTGDRDVLYAVQVVPEPATGCLLLLAVMMLSQLRRPSHKSSISMI